jgi:hypothetical protein
MRIYDFKALTKTEKAKAVWKGKLLANREEDNYNILLFNLGDFYVEVFYNANENKIVKFKSFTTFSQLEPYLEKISISEIQELL